MGQDQNDGPVVKSGTDVRLALPKTECGTRAVQDARTQGRGSES